MTSKLKQKRSVPDYEETRLLAALGEEGCPVCCDIAGSDDHYFFWFFNENYYEFFTLDALTRSLGFCLAHGARLTRTVVGSHQLAAVHEVLVRRIRAMLLGFPSAHTRGAPRAPALATYALCPACRDREEMAGRTSFWMAKLLEDPATADHYARPGMLCFPHLQAVLPRLSTRTLDRLLSVHESALASAIESLSDLHAELNRTTSDNRQDLVKALLPFLRLAVGHDPGNGAYPSLDDSRVSPLRRDPVGDFLGELRQPGACAVCCEVRRAWIEWIRWLDDATPRAVVVDDLLPVCPEHVWPTVHLGGTFLAIGTARQALSATLWQIRTAIQLLKPPPPKDPERPLERIKRILLGPRRRLRAAREVLARGLPCPVCARLAVARDQALSLLFALLEDRRHRAAWENGYGLCLKHFSRALALDPAPALRGLLVEVQAGKLARLHWELDESLRKTAWNYRPEAKGTEGAAWRRAVLRFSGSLAEPADSG